MDLGPVVENLAFNSFFQDYEARPARTAAAQQVITAATGRLMIVTHQVNISALTGRGVRSGEVLIVRQGAEGLDVLGSVLIAP